MEDLLEQSGSQNVYNILWEKTCKKMTLKNGWTNCLQNWVYNLVEHFLGNKKIKIGADIGWKLGEIKGLRNWVVKTCRLNSVL